MVGHGILTRAVQCSLFQVVREAFRARVKQLYELDCALFLQWTILRGGPRVEKLVQHLAPHAPSV